MLLYVYRLVQLVMSITGLVTSVWALAQTYDDREWICKSGRNGIYRYLVSERLWLNYLIPSAQVIPFIFGLMSVFSPQRQPVVYTWRSYFVLTAFMLLTAILTGMSCVILYYRTKTVTPVKETK